RGHRDAPDRHKTMRNAINWSYELLDGEEQRLFRSVAVFVGGFRVDAADSVFPGTANTSRPAFDGIGSLIDQSLLQLSPGVVSPPRCVFLEKIREFAREQLEASAEGPHVRRRHAELFLELAEEAEPHVVSAARGAWLSRLDEELDNIRAALEWSRQ